MNVCRECPVQQQCAAAGAGERYGIWGGLTEARRKRQRQARNRSGQPRRTSGMGRTPATSAKPITASLPVTRVKRPTPSFSRRNGGSGNGGNNATSGRKRDELLQWVRVPAQR